MHSCAILAGHSLVEYLGYNERDEVPRASHLASIPRAYMKMVMCMCYSPSCVLLLLIHTVPTHPPRWINALKKSTMTNYPLTTFTRSSGISASASFLDSIVVRYELFRTFTFHNLRVSTSSFMMHTPLPFPPSSLPSSLMKISLDEESWYSVTPEVIAKHIAERCFSWPMHVSTADADTGKREMSNYESQQKRGVKKRKRSSKGIGGHLQVHIGMSEYSCVLDCFSGCGRWKEWGMLCNYNSLFSPSLPISLSSSLFSLLSFLLYLFRWMTRPKVETRSRWLLDCRKALWSPPTWIEVNSTPWKWMQKYTELENGLRCRNSLYNWCHIRTVHCIASTTYYSPTTN